MSAVYLDKKGKARGPILDRLGDDGGRVFSIKRLEDGTFRVREECDRWFQETLTADELRALGQELIDISNGGASE